MTDTVSPIATPTEIVWHAQSATRWVAYRGATRMGCIDHLGAFIATNQHTDVIGAFAHFAEAQRAIADPEQGEADLVRGSRARQARRDAQLRRAALIGMAAALLVLALVAAILLTSARP